MPELSSSVGTAAGSVGSRALAQLAHAILQPGTAGRKEGRKDSAAHTTLKDHPLNYNCFDVSAGSEEED